MWSSPVRLVSRIVLLCALVACGGDKQSVANPQVLPAGSKPATSAPSAAAPEATGVIEGVIVLEEGAALPRLPNPKETSKLVVVNPPRPCTPLDDNDLQPVKRDAATGGLSSVHVALTGMASTAPVAPRTHELRLVNCRLNQPLLAARLGDSVRITNGSESALLPSMPGDSFMEAILPNQSRTIELKRVGSSRIACGFSSYCGQTDLLVTSHSLFAVSDATGHFRIDNVPLDRELTVHAWHPLFDESHETFTLTRTKDAATRTVKLVLKPLPVAAVAPAPTKAGKPKPDKIVVQ